MVTHWAAFVAAIIFLTIQYTLFAIHGTLQEDRHKAEHEDPSDWELWNYLNIFATFCYVMGLMCWAYV